MINYIQTITPHFNHIQRSIIERAKTLNVPVIKPDTALYLISLLSLTNPKKVVELGSGLGYSAYIFAKYGMKNIEVISVDISFPAQRRAEEMVAVDPVSDQISWVHLDGALYLKNNNLLDVDFFFIDALKDAYETYFNLIQSQKWQQGRRYTIVFDNLFLDGAVETRISGKGRRMHRLIRKLLYSYPERFTLLPIGDGIGLFIGE